VAEAALFVFRPPAGAPSKRRPAWNSDASDRVYAGRARRNSTDGSKRAE